MEQFQNICGMIYQIVQYFVMTMEYAVFMNLEGFKIGLDTKDRVDIMVVKCKPDMISVMTHMKGFLPGYHMDKSNWITILLDGTVQEAKILDFLDMSYDLTDGRIEESIE